MVEKGNTDDQVNSYEALFVLLAFLISVATVLVAIGGIYFNFINPSF